MKLLKIFLTLLFILILNNKTANAERVLEFNSLSNNTEFFEGKTLSNSRINLLRGEKIIKYTYSNGSGEFLMYIESGTIKGGETLTVSVINNGYEYYSKNLVVKDNIPPKKAKINYITSNSRKLIITGEPNSFALIKIPKATFEKKLSKKGNVEIEIPKLNVDDQIDIRLKDSANNISNKATFFVDQSMVSSSKQMNLKAFSTYEKQNIQNKFLNEISNYARKQKYAYIKQWHCDNNELSDCFIKNGNNKIQVLDNNEPGYYAFSKHAIGGVVLYKPINNKYKLVNDEFFFHNENWFKERAKKGTDIEFYILCDDGNIYSNSIKRESLRHDENFGRYKYVDLKIDKNPKYKFLKNNNKDLNNIYKSILKNI